MKVDLGEGNAYTERSGGPERIYDKEAAGQPLPPKGPFGFAPPKVEKDPQVWEGED